MFRGVFNRDPDLAELSSVYKEVIEHIIKLICLYKDQEIVSQFRENLELEISTKYCEISRFIIDKILNPFITSIGIQDDFNTYIHKLDTLLIYPLRLKSSLSVTIYIRNLIHHYKSILTCFILTKEFNYNPDTIKKYNPVFSPHPQSVNVFQNSIRIVASDVLLLGRKQDLFELEASLGDTPTLIGKKQKIFEIIMDTIQSTTECEVTSIPGGSKPTQTLQKTNLRVQINGQTRVVYLNKYKTQYVKYKNEYIPLSKAKKLEKNK